MHAGAGSTHYRVAAVNGDRGAGNEVRGSAGEEHGDALKVVDVAPATGRRARHDALVKAIHLAARDEASSGRRYRQAGLTVLRRLLEPPYLSLDEAHEGLLLHAVYHRPNGWDHVQTGQQIPNGESCMWGDYHLREAALLVQREIDRRPPYRFFNGLPGTTG